jgi:cytochrome c biogenesis factor
VVLGGYDMQRQTASFKVIINPLVSWIWIGFLVLTFGVLLLLVGALVVVLARPRVAGRAEPGEVT